MNKAEFITKVAQTGDMTKKDASHAIDAVFQTLGNALVDNESLQIVGFGRFIPTTRSARMGRNVKTGETIEIPERRTVKFKIGRTLKDAMNGNA